MQINLRLPETFLSIQISVRVIISIFVAIIVHINHHDDHLKKQVGHLQPSDHGSDMKSRESIVAPLCVHVGPGAE